MRRLVAALVMVMVAASLAACSSPAPTDTTAPAGDPAAAGASGTVPASETPAPPSDTLSPTQSVDWSTPFNFHPDKSPQAVRDRVAAKQPMLILIFDPKSKVTKDQRVEVDAVMKSYRGSIDLLTYDYTMATTPSDGSAVPSETAKAALMIGELKVNTTPYIVLVDAAGRVTYRFSGFVDRTALEREVIRATE